MTINDIAKLAGVSISTVSKIINGKDTHIKPETRTKVLQIVKEYNFVPYASTKHHAAARNYLLGVLLRSVKKGSLMLQGIIRTAQSQGYGVIVLDSQEDSIEEAKNITALCKNGVDAVIWEPVSENSYDHSHELDKHHIPYRFINSPEDTSSYMIDYEQIGYFLTEKLIQKNHSNIVCFFSENFRFTSQFLEGFQRCLYANQIPYTDDMVFISPCENMVEQLIQKNVTGIISTEFDITISIYKTLKNHHYHVPTDFSLVSLKNHPYDEYFSQLISIMQLPSYNFGAYVCEQIIHICEKTDSHDEVFLFQPEYKLNHELSVEFPAFMNTKPIISIGGIHKDFTFNVNQLPQLGHSVKIHNTATTLGGKGANQAIGIAKLGIPVCLIAAIGDDFDSSFLLNTLERENVSTIGICRIPQAPTGKAYIYTESNGESAISIFSGANDSLTSADILSNQYLFRNSRYCMISDEIPLDVITTAFHIAKTNHMTTILKPSVQDKLPEEFFHMIDIFVPNQKEAAILCPEHISYEEQAEYFFQKGIPIVIITLGHNGCYLKTKDTAQLFPSTRWPAVDTTGGADAFISTLVSYLHDGYSLENAVQIANISAGFCVSRQGVTSALIDRNSLELYIAKTKPELLNFLQPEVNKRTGRRHYQCR